MCGTSTHALLSNLARNRPLIGESLAVLRLPFLKHRKRVPNDVRKEKHRGTEDTEYSAVVSSVPLCFNPFHPKIAEYGYVLTPGRSVCVAILKQIKSVKYEWHCRRLSSAVIKKIDTDYFEET